MSKKDLSEEILSTGPIVFYIFDINTGSNIYVTPNCLNVYGYTSEEVLAAGPKFREMIHPDDLKNSLISGTTLLNLKGFQKDVSHLRMMHKDGHYMQIRRTIFVHERDPSGTPKTFLIITEDVSDEAGKMPPAERQRLIFRAVIDNAPLMLYLKDINDKLRVTLWNKGAETILNVPNHVAVGKTIDEICPKEYADIDSQADANVISEKKMLNTEEVLSHKQKGLIRLRTKRVPVDIGPNERYLLTISEDITTQVTMQKMLTQSAKMSSLGEMAAGISHEINNPLAVIRVKAALLRRMLGKSTYDLKNIDRELSIIEETALRIGKISTGLLLFSRSSETDPFQPTHVSQIVEDTVALCKERFKKNKIEFTTNCNLDLMLECRPLQVSQILMSLLNNAYDAVVNLEKKWVILDVSALDSKVRFSVTDSGKAIPTEIAEKMMEPFFTTKDIGKGMGLGLSVSKGIAEDHLGDLRYDSDSGNVRFTLELPLKQQQKPSD